MGLEFSLEHVNLVGWLTWREQLPSPTTSSAWSLWESWLSPERKERLSDTGVEDMEGPDDSSLRLLGREGTGAAGPWKAPRASRQALHDFLRSLPSAIHTNRQRYREGVRRAVEQSLHELESMPPGESTGIDNRVVVRHQYRRVTLIGVRHNETGREFDVNEFQDFYPIVRSFPLQTMADVEATLSEMKPLEQEGYVIVDGAFNRVKVKSPAYVAIHHMTDGFGPRRIVEVIRRGETSELLALFPEWKPDFNVIQWKYDALVIQIEADYARLKDISEQKAFALEAVKTVCSAALFQLRRGTVTSAKQFLAAMQIKSLMDKLRVKDAELETDVA